MLRIFSFILVLQLVSFGYCYAQEDWGEKTIKFQSHKDVVEFAVSDTNIGFNFYIPIKIKFKDNPEIQIYTNQTWYLYQYFQKHYGWSGTEFFETMRDAIYSNKPIEIEELPNFKFKNLISEKECSCYFNNKKEINTFIKNGTYPPPREKLFPCFVYKLLKLNILLSYAEAKLGYSDYRPDIKRNRKK
ncbi:MAG TPA: hypothetical protein PKX92_12385 [Edaphocola sp.]|nr:hypothetical protein [Edaphocola sp.]